MQLIIILMMAYYEYLYAQSYWSMSLVNEYVRLAPKYAKGCS